MTESASAWRELRAEERRGAWDRFYYPFRFRPSTSPEEWPGILEPVPSVTWNVEAAWQDPDPLLRGPNRIVNSSFLAAFRVCRAEKLVVLDWQHPCYGFSVHHESAPVAPEDWPIPVLPTGDYSIFLSPSFDRGCFGHPWEQTVCVFGQELLAAIEDFVPSPFGRVVRRNGLAV